VVVDRGDVLGLMRLDSHAVGGFEMKVVGHVSVLA
jgi:hypothetical protein